MAIVNDKLNTMTLEEKAKLLREQWWCNYCPCLDMSVKQPERPDCGDTDCIIAIARWLSSEYKD